MTGMDYTVLAYTLGGGLVWGYAFRLIRQNLRIGTARGTRPAHATTASTTEQNTSVTNRNTMKGQA